MMKLKKELPLIAMVLLPFIYLGYVWNSLPDEVPMQWGINGEVNRYGSKMELALVALLLPVFFYVMFSIVPKIDPKNKLNQMGGKLTSIKFFLIAIISLLSLFIIYMAKNQSITNPNYVLLLVGVLYLVLGNFFKTIKANYFIGIRTPWTLESESVWKATHKMAGKMWFVGGIIVVLSGLMLSKEANFTIFITITAIITVVPIAYSYFKFQKLTK